MTIRDELAESLLHQAAQAIGEELDGDILDESSEDEPDRRKIALRVATVFDLVWISMEYEVD